MAVTVVATVGSATANSYLTVADADTLLNLRLGIDLWTAASTDDKGRALIMATRDIDSNRFHGYKVDSAQALEFPRSGQSVASTSIPPEVLNACAEQALWNIQHASTGGRSDRQQLAAQGVSSYTVGSLSETLRGGYAMGSLCPESSKFIRGWVTRTGHLIGPRDQSVYDYGSGWTSGPFS